MARRGKQVDLLGGLWKMAKALTKPAIKSESNSSVKRTPSKMANRHGGDDFDGYPIGVVGEANYQKAIKQVREGQQVVIVIERGNPFDSEALAVTTGTGETLGYLPRESWVHRIVFSEERGCSATIKRKARAEGTSTFGLVLDLKAGGAELQSRLFQR